MISAPARMDSTDTVVTRRTALSFQQVSKRFGGSPLALEDVTWSVATGVARVLARTEWCRQEHLHPPAAGR